MNHEVTSSPLDGSKPGDSSSGSLTIRGHELRTETRLFEQAKLKFYVDNPRIYSIVRQSGREPSQNTILERLSALEHVRELVVDIKRNGGLVEPLIVKPETAEVLEGNSRLAAYRLLFLENPIKWNLVKCTFLPSGLDDKLIFALLGQYHIKGKKSWAPFEQAGFLYRRYKDHGLDVDQLAREIGLKVGEVKLLIQTFELMLQHDKDIARWSYYYEYLKSRKIKKARETYAVFDDLVVRKIKNGEIAKAVDIRDQLSKIVAGPPRILQKFATGALSFEGAVDALVGSGADTSIYRRLNKFRLFLVSDDVKQMLKEGTPEERKKIIFELEKIYNKARILLSK